MSGNGGTGKTGITAAFAAFARRPLIADCDVDAASFHPVLPPRVRTDAAVTGAQMRSLSAVETGSGAGEDMTALLENILKLAGLPGGPGF